MLRRKRCPAAEGNRADRSDFFRQS